MITRPLPTLLLLGLACTGCAGASVRGDEGTIAHPVERVAIAPVGGRFADDLATGLVEASRNGLQALGATATAELLERTGVTSLTATQPRNLARLREAGVDLWLRAETVTHQLADTPQTVDVRATSTHDPAQAFAFEWRNAWGGMPGSPADGTMRLDHAASVAAVVQEILARLRSDGAP